jgi:protein-L-isoaspartate O-methyltransferase
MAATPVSDDGAVLAARLCKALVKRGAVGRDSGAAAAFARVDRAAFCPASYEGVAFDDAPLRAWDEAAGCVVHLSAPSIYAAALEALELEEREPRHGGPLSFLNVGSGSGYFSALVATRIGPDAARRAESDRRLKG